MCTSTELLFLVTLVLAVAPISAHRYHQFRPGSGPMIISKLPNIIYPSTSSVLLPGQQLFPNTYTSQFPTIPQIPAISSQQQTVRPMTGEFWQTQPNAVQRVPASVSRCRTSRGCASGEECVFADNWQCPDWIPNLKCQCRQGCRHQNTFIPFGKTVIVDKCGNKCSCFNVYGAPECSFESC
ncbi:uncharacterized protein LOC132546915 [Ylistrum balloti]|uniref:uncharacterized protein LOC132546915 n=1 Tax=Ylistrum balloti TaxID=509963 RepID=UPI002905827E|nr:uncharacterized protein LOC132546915 [Ylistrum balloti]